ncbi:hypothetical protein CV_3090 [Chromobacterium violaceum ATCC 12472]|uniref:Uncharacterized protein n=1 Tax=Chromobacterium violaceum (strain ATCC 12472 / DSM 30191 / JCM 1249 / CCUG 213 / NBRC 12614 / NCIMB 9131 / NCTC 9757 / MK) TaxID=243365 RepID=Q7NPR8_CHRVO|nr:hypothetical protein CV_3090 [Chromobacterium violaceum ATCC 12472]
MWQCSGVWASIAACRTASNWPPIRRMPALPGGWIRTSRCCRLSMLCCCLESHSMHRRWAPSRGKCCRVTSSCMRSSFSAMSPPTIVRLSCARWSSALARLSISGISISWAGAVGSLRLSVRSLSSYR